MLQLSEQEKEEERERGGGIRGERGKGERKRGVMDWGSHHFEVKSTNSGEKRSGGSWGDGSSTTCLSCWNGVPHDSYGKRRMAISI